MLQFLEEGEKWAIKEHKMNDQKNKRMRRITESQKQGENIKEKLEM